MNRAALEQDSIFDSTFGCHADGVDFTTVAYAPAGWRDRVLRFESPATQGAVGLCMDPADLAVAKLCAGRDKDREFVAALLSARLVARPAITERLALVTAPAAVLTQARARLASM